MIEVLDSGEVAITLTRGDSDDITISVVDSETPPVAVNLSTAVDGTANRPAIIRFAVKASADLTNAEAVVFKDSHASDEIEVLPQSGATLGKCALYLEKADTEGAEPGEYVWDVEVSRQAALKVAASVGTLAFTSGSNVVTGTGTAFRNARAGDILHPTSGASSGKPAIIDKIVSDTSVQVSWGGFPTESLVTFEIRRGQHKTAVRGPFTLAPGVVAQ
jgi:hypothetical protein